MVFPDRFRNHLLARPAAHPERLLPHAGDAARVRRHRRQHRLQPEAARRRSAAHGHRRRGYRSPTCTGSSASASAPRTLKQIAGQFTAQAFITTDLDDNQITAFHPGAMNHSHENHVDARAGRGAGDRRARRQGGHAAARARVRRARHPVPVRPGPGPADVLRRGTAGDRAARRLRRGQRLRRQAAGGEDRAQARGAGARGEGADRHAGRAGLA